MAGQGAPALSLARPSSPLAHAVLCRHLDVSATLLRIEDCTACLRTLQTLPLARCDRDPPA
eukprot:3799128-Rhodomonas_salina.1